MTLRSAEEIMISNNLTVDHGIDIEDIENIIQAIKIAQREALEAAELYARSKFDEACEEMRRSCLGAYMAIDVYDHSNKFETIDREMEAISQAPKPEFKP